jgi:hypothetical protein
MMEEVRNKKSILQCHTNPTELHQQERKRVVSVNPLKHSGDDISLQL